MNVVSVRVCMFVHSKNDIEIRERVKYIGTGSGVWKYEQRKQYTRELQFIESENGIGFRGWILEKSKKAKPHFGNLYEIMQTQLICALTISATQK